MNAVKIVVLGGSGHIGSKLVSSFREGGTGVLGKARTVLAAAPYAQAVCDAEIVVDITDSPLGKLIVEAAAGVNHYIMLSTVGIDRHPQVAYFREQIVRENQLKASGIPYSIVRATLYFESMPEVVQEGSVGQAVHVSPALVQPVASGDVVTLLAGLAAGSPRNATVEIAGPDLMPLDEAVLKYLLSKNDQRPVICDVHARWLGLELDDTTLTPGERPQIGSTHFEEWLKI